MNRTGSPLSSPAVKHLASAVTAGVVVYLRPARVSKGLRRALLVTNSAGSATAMLVGSTPRAGGVAQPAPLAKRVGPNAARIGDVATLVGSLASSASLLASRPAQRLDGRVERSLTARGVARPRLVMAVGAAGAVVLLGVVADRIAKVAEQKVAEAQGQAEQSGSRVSSPAP